MWDTHKHANTHVDIICIPTYKFVNIYKIHMRRVAQLIQTATLAKVIRDRWCIEAYDTIIFLLFFNEDF